MSLWTTYIYRLKWILDERLDIKDSGIKEDLISYPLFLQKNNFHVVYFPILAFGRHAPKRLTLKANICSHIVMAYSFNLLVCTPLGKRLPQRMAGDDSSSSSSFVQTIKWLLRFTRATFIFLPHVDLVRLKLRKRSFCVLRKKINPSVIITQKNTWKKICVLKQNCSEVT